MSTQKNRGGPVWPLGFVQVAAAGTPVNLMTNVDPAGNHSPGSGNSEYAWTCRGILFGGFKPAANNNGYQVNTGNVYVCVQAGNNGNRADYGAIALVVTPGNYVPLPVPLPGTDMINPYQFQLDADVSNEGALAVLLGSGNP